MRPLPQQPLYYIAFEYVSKNIIMVHGANPLDGARLRELLFSNELKSKRAQGQAEKDAKRLMTKSWLIGQLTHYDISFDEKATKVILTKILRESIRGGKVIQQDAINILSS